MSQKSLTILSSSTGFTNHYLFFLGGTWISIFYILSETWYSYWDDWSSVLFFTS